MPFFKFFIIFNVLNIAWVANVTHRYFILIATYVGMCFKNKMFLHATQKHFSFFNYRKKCGESVSLLVHFVFFTIFYKFFNDKVSVSNTVNY